MPEGDTIFRAAATLRRALAGKPVTRFVTALAHLARVDDAAPVAGRTVEDVASAGKHLLMHFSGGLHLRTHMRMNGSWHIYRPGERWKKRQTDMRIVVETADFVAVAFNVPVAEFLDDAALARQPELRELGPDLLGTFDLAAAIGRARARPQEEIADILLNQRVAAGLGNVYKSEVLFACRVNPFTPVSGLDDATLAELFTRGGKLMRHNVETISFSRETTNRLDPTAGLWVYGRGGEPCRVCGTQIAYRKQGRDARGTYWCPRCQP